MSHADPKYYDASKIDADGCSILPSLIHKTMPDSGSYYPWIGTEKLGYISVSDIVTMARKIEQLEEEIRILKLRT